MATHDPSQADDADGIDRTTDPQGTDPAADPRADYDYVGGSTRPTRAPTR